MWWQLSMQLFELFTHLSHSKPAQMHQNIDPMVFFNAEIDTF